MSHENYLKMLNDAAGDSDDPDTKTACIAVLADGVTVLAGTNHIPDPLRVTPERVQRPLKYAWIMHAEEVVISLAAYYGKRCYGAMVYLNWFPCVSCARLLISAGIKTLDADKAAYEARKADPRYGFAVSMEMLTEAGVEIRWH